MKLKLPKATANGHRQIARALWRNAPNLPTAAERVQALKQAALHAGLARALERNPNLGLAKSAAQMRLGSAVVVPTASFYETLP